MEKILLMHVAAQLTQAACGGAGNSLPISPDLSDNNVRAKNLQTWETFRVFYVALVAALKDTTSWPQPDIQAGSLLPNLLQSAAPLLSNSPLKDIIGKVLNLIPSTPPPISGPVPLPGQPKTS